MNSRHAPQQKKSAVQHAWSRRFDQWRELLARCGEKASRKRVHALRVATLRLKAEVDFRRRCQGSTDELDEAAKSWKKHGARLRRALGPVRDTDVHLQILEKLRAADGLSGETSQLTPACLEEIKEAETLLGKERESAEKELHKEIEKLRSRLEHASRELEEALATKNEWAENDRSRLIRGIVAGLATEVIGLRADTLHAFRKQAKTARYLADASVKKDAASTRQAALLKRMQNAAGKWHDLETLAERAAGVMGKIGGSELRDILGTLAHQSYETALDVCRDTMGELLAHGAKMGAARWSLPPKKPVQSEKAAGVPVGGAHSAKSVMTS